VVVYGRTNSTVKVTNKLCFRLWSAAFVRYYSISNAIFYCSGQSYCGFY